MVLLLIMHMCVRVLASDVYTVTSNVDVLVEFICSHQKRDIKIHWQRGVTAGASWNKRLKGPVQGLSLGNSQLYIHISRRGGRDRQWLLCI